MHNSGQFISGEATAKPTKNDAQGLGSVLSYLRRYGLQALAGLAAEDDDGNAGSTEIFNVDNERHRALFKKLAYDAGLREVEDFESCASQCKGLELSVLSAAIEDWKEGMGRK